MNNHLDKIEEDLKKNEPSANRRKKQKVSGRSVFKLQEIIQQKAVSSEVERKEKSKSLDVTRDKNTNNEE